ncbi:hypothetical protein [Escherichia coli]|uniref:hypothetical protein n=1 Tax=Escherichia coli TaxID=562 RepID=UPI0027D2B18A|nr:hypothetical protein [Escherichia coli]
MKLLKLPRTSNPIPANEILLLPPERSFRFAFALENKPVDQPRKADVIMLDGKHISSKR